MEILDDSDVEVTMDDALASEGGVEERECKKRRMTAAKGKASPPCPTPTDGMAASPPVPADEAAAHGDTSMAAAGAGGASMPSDGRQAEMDPARKEYLAQQESEMRCKLQELGSAYNALLAKMQDMEKKQHMLQFAEPHMHTPPPRNPVFTPDQLREAPTVIYEASKFDCAEKHLQPGLPLPATIDLEQGDLRDNAMPPGPETFETADDREKELMQVFDLDKED